MCTVMHIFTSISATVAEICNRTEKKTANTTLPCQSIGLEQYTSTMFMNPAVKFKLKLNSVKSNYRDVVLYVRVPASSSSIIHQDSVSVSARGAPDEMTSLVERLPNTPHLNPVDCQLCGLTQQPVQFARQMCRCRSSKAACE